MGLTSYYSKREDGRKLNLVEIVIDTTSMNAHP